MTSPPPVSDGVRLQSPAQPGRRIAAASILIPVAALFLIWWRALGCWFIADDFAWLSLLPGIHDFHDFLRALFAPMAQGTIRPWSERGFFILFESLFGLDPLPYRLCVFLTAAFDAVLIGRLALRLTNSRFAAILAPLLWIANAALADALCWTCVYNELLCPLFFLGALLLFIRWIDTGERRWWWWQLVVFTLGFGALELNIVYPALAAAFVLFRGDRLRPVAPPRNANGPRYASMASVPVSASRALLSLIPLFVLSAAYFLAHRIAAPIPKSGVYALHFDLRIFSTLALYWKWTMMPQNWAAVGIGRHIAQAATALLSAAFLAALVAGVRAGRRQILFGPAWFLITLAPLVPLYDHRSYYYLTIPVIGIAIAAADGMRLAWQSRKWRPVAAAALLIYFAFMIPAGRAAARWWRDRTIPIRSLVLSVAQARENHPRRAIVLEGVTDELYNDAIAHGAFRDIHVARAYLAPETGLAIHPSGDPAVLRAFVIDAAVFRRALLDDSVVIYSVSSGHLRNITTAYRRKVLGG